MSRSVARRSVIVVAAAVLVSVFSFGNGRFRTIFAAGPGPGDEWGYANCHDGSDNDGDGLIDCADNKTSDGDAAHTCWHQEAYGCSASEQYRFIDEALTKQLGGCTDGIDDDFDNSFTNAWDNSPTTGVDCQDTDCKGDPACPSKENIKDGVQNDDLCFNVDAFGAAIDDDLNGPANCQDPACSGAISADGNKICTDSELSVSGQYNFCSNGFDDDGNGVMDCADASCRSPVTGGMFGNCGPCPNREDLNFEACADGLDNDSSGLTDCQDPTCHPTSDKDYSRLGTLIYAAYCAASENSDALCNDGHDNDANGSMDCQEPGCVGKLGPGGRRCESPETSCNDKADNDGNGLADCVDPSCSGSLACFNKDWTDFTCIEPAQYSCKTVTVPDLLACDVNPETLPTACRNVPAPFPVQVQYACLIVPDYLPKFVAPYGTRGFPLTGAASTLFGRVYGTVHESLPGLDNLDQILIEGAGSYDSFTVVIGDNTDPAKYYPYASTDCVLSGSGAAQMAISAVPGHALQIFSVSSPINSVNLKLDCPTVQAAVSPTRFDYPVSVAVSRADGSPETGDVETADVEHFFTILYEAVRPAIRYVEGEAQEPQASGTAVPPVMKVPHGQYRSLRLVPDNDSSGICRCSADIDLLPATSVGPDCVTEKRVFRNSGAYTIKALSEDGAGNVGDIQDLTVDVQVTPAVDLVNGGTLVINTPGKPFIKMSRRRVGVEAQFATGQNFVGWGVECVAHLRKADGSEVAADWTSAGVSRTFVGQTPGQLGSGGLNTASCRGYVTLPHSLLSGAPIEDGEYFLSLSITDPAGGYGESNRRAVYYCNHTPTYLESKNAESVCAKADFDNDGATEGLYTTMYSTSPKSCDNCVALSNPDQFDDDANGIGNACEATEPYGRCEIDREIVCTAPKYVSATDPTIPPVPMCDPATDPQCCPQPSVKDGSRCTALFPMVGSPPVCTPGETCCAARAMIPPKPPEDPIYKMKAFPQYCDIRWGLCSVGGMVCLGDWECSYCATLKDGKAVGCHTDQDCVDAGELSGTCLTGAGAGKCAADTAKACRTNADCGEDGPCSGACSQPEGDGSYKMCGADAECGTNAPCLIPNFCDRLIPPWIETSMAGLYSSQRITARKLPPRLKFNATYCITAKGSVANFRSEFTYQPCSIKGTRVEPTLRYEVPQQSNAYLSILGRLDIKGLRAGRYGTAVTLEGTDLSDPQKIKSILTNPLEGRVYVVEGNDLIIPDLSGLDIPNAADGGTGTGTFLVIGHNIEFKGDVGYKDFPVINKLDQLASVAWIAVPDDSGQEGGIRFAKNVTRSVGAFFSGGSEGIWTVWPVSQDAYDSLVIQGLMMARAFHMERIFQSLDQGSEQVTYDGRAVANPPPGLGDLSRALPRFGGAAQ